MLKRLLPLLLLFLSTWTLAEPLRTGLVLSGGGARGLAHIGVLKQLEESGALEAHGKTIVVYLPRG